MIDEDDSEESAVPWAKFDGPNTATLDEVKNWLSTHMEDGAICAACERVVKVYKRKITSSMAHVLILLAKHYKTNSDWIHVPSFINAAGLPPEVSAAVRGDWAKLTLWGLLIEKPMTREDGSNRAGYYKVTPEGISFSENKVFMPRHVFIYNRQNVGFSKEHVRIVDVLGDRFNYNELISS